MNNRKRRWESKKTRRANNEDYYKTPHPTSKDGQSEVLDYLQNSGASKPWMAKKDTSYSNYSQPQGNPFKDKEHSNSKQPPKWEKFSDIDDKMTSGEKKAMLQSSQDLTEERKNHMRKVITKYACRRGPPRLEDAVSVLSRKLDAKKRQKNWEETQTKQNVSKNNFN